MQTVLLGMLAKAFAVQQGVAPPTPLLTRLQGLRRSSSASSPAASGPARPRLALLAVARWRDVGFGDLPPADSVRIVVPAVTVAALGVQLAFSGFALAILQFGREIRLKRAHG